jgi:KaiC/GvpD/RAD55 family RecA-like ATPase
MTDKIDWRTMNRVQQVVLYVVTMMDNLKEAGIVEGGTFSSTDEGRAMVTEMLEAAENGEWVSPTEDELHFCLNAIQNASREMPTEDSVLH